MSMRPTGGGRVIGANATLKQLIVLAYRIQPFQVLGGPDWTDSLQYDIEAKPDSAVRQSDLPAMLQALLADRFQLVVHRETRQLPIYTLVLARKDGQLGPGITETKEGGCTPADPSKPAPPPEPGKLPNVACGKTMLGLSQLRAVAAPVGDVLPMLSRALGRIVVDNTGLTGKFDIVVDFALDESQIAALLPPGASVPTTPPDSSRPSIFAALQEQLGLKLEAQRGPVEMFVIDHAEKPSAN
jgi:uncharacterized protein (TIGR03435 family)